MNKGNRLKRLEDKIGTKEDRITEIIIDFINPDGTVASTMIKKIGTNYKVKI